MLRHATADYDDKRRILQREMRQRIPQEVWDAQMVASPDFPEQLADWDGDPDDWDGMLLLNALRAAMAMRSHMMREPDKPEAVSEAEPSMPPHVVSSERDRAFSRMIATWADNHSDIQEFRQRHLNGRLLPEDEDCRIWVTKQPQTVEEELVALTKEFRGLWWREFAVRFILTGWIPPLDTIWTKITGHPVWGHKISVEAPPFVKPEQIVEAFKDARDQFITTTKDGETYSWPPPAGYTLSEKTLRLAEFAWQPHVTDRTWREKLEQWNALCEDPDHRAHEPGWVFQSRRAFASRARDAVERTSRGHFFI